jgi:hypothetical protein
MLHRALLRSLFSQTGSVRLARNGLPRPTGLPFSNCYLTRPKVHGASDNETDGLSRNPDDCAMGRVDH